MPVLNNETADDPLMYDICDSFVQGQSSFTRSNRLDYGQAALLVNMDIRRDGVLATRRGTELLVNATDLTRIQGLAFYTTPEHQYLVAISGQSAYSAGIGVRPAYFLWDGTAWTGVTLTDGTLLPSDTTTDINTVQGVDKLYIADGLHQLLYFDGTTIKPTGTGGTNPPVSNILCWHTNRLFIGGSATIPDQLAASDYLDGTKFDLQDYSIRVGADESDPIVGLASWQQYQLVVLKRNSLWIVNTDPTIDTVSPFAGSWNVQRVHDSIGCISNRSVCQVGQDIWFLSDTGVRSVRRVLATDQNEISDTISYPIQDLIDRINQTVAHKSAAIFWNNRYMISVALDSAEEPNAVLVYNTLTQSWSGYWTGWTPLQFSISILDGERRLNFADPQGQVHQWLDYVSPLAETTTDFQDHSGDSIFADIASQLVTRGMTFKEILSPKKGNHIETEFYESTATANLDVILDQGSPASVADSITTYGNVVLLPQTLPFLLPALGVFRRAFDLMQFDPWRELQAQVTASAGKLSIRGIFASAFFDTILLEE